MRSPEAGAKGASDVRFGTLALLVAAMCVIHIVSQFLRNSIGVIAPDLARDMGLGAAGIGFLASAFFLGFAGAQIPLGVAIDRWGPRVSMSVSMGIAVAGVILFAVAPTSEILILARILMGLGCASFFMGPLTIYSRWFPPERFSTLVGIQLGFSGLGVLAATAPLAYATAAIGWRASFLVVAVVAGLVGMFVYVVARDDPPGSARPKSGETLRESFAGLANVVRVRSFLPVFAMQFAGYASFLTVFGLWAGPYLAHVYGYDLDRRGETLLVLAVVHLISSAAWGPVDRLFKSYKIPATIGAGMTVAALIWIVVVGKPSEAGLLVWFVVFGFFASCTAVITAHGRSLFPPEYVGRGLTLLNLGTMGGVFVMQAASGAVVGLFAAPDGIYPLDAYRAAFAFEAAVLGLATLIYQFSYEPKRGGP
ncbi:MAG: MFS transporter [Xanthobacteraceae bacterium]